MKGTRNTQKIRTGNVKRTLEGVGRSLQSKALRLLWCGMRTEPGIDGILVTVGLCIIALLLCVVMKDSLQTFIETIVGAMTTEAQNILTGVAQ